MDQKAIFSVNIKEDSIFPQWHWIDQKREVVVLKTDQGFKAFSSICPHMGAQMLVAESNNCKLTCPWHGLSFENKDGAQLSNHKTYRRLQEYDVRFINGELSIFTKAGT